MSLKDDEVDEIRRQVLGMKQSGKFKAFTQAFNDFENPVWIEVPDPLEIDYKSYRFGNLADKMGRKVDLAAIINDIRNTGTDDDREILLWLLNIPWEKGSSEGQWTLVYKAIIEALSDLHNEQVANRLHELLIWLSTAFSHLDSPEYYGPPGMWGLIDSTLQILTHYNLDQFEKTLEDLFREIQHTYYHLMAKGYESGTSILELVVSAMLKTSGSRNTSDFLVQFIDAAHGQIDPFIVSELVKIGPNSIDSVVPLFAEDEKKSGAAFDVLSDIRPPSVVISKLRDYVKEYEKTGQSVNYLILLLEEQRKMEHACSSQSESIEIGEGLVDLECLQNNPKLKQLVFTHSHFPVSYFEYITKLSELEELQIHSWIKDGTLAPLGNFPNLKKLYLRMSEIPDPDLDVLKKCPNLRIIVLYLSGVKEIDLTPLSELNLLRLNLSLVSGRSRNSVSEINLDPITRCTEIEMLSLNVEGVNEIDLSSLSKLTKLIDLHISTSVKSLDLRELETCTELESLEIEPKTGQFHELHLASNANLRNLKIRRYSLSKSFNLRSLDLSPLASSKLESLEIKNAGLESIDLSPLSSCDNLTKIELYRNRLHEVILPSCAKLEELIIPDEYYMKTIDLTPLSNCSSLKTLYLGGNLSKIDLSPLSECRELKKTWLFTNFVDLSPLSSIQTIEDVYILGLMDSNSLDLTPISNCIELTKLIVSAKPREEKGRLPVDFTPLLDCTQLKEVSLGLGKRIKKHPWELPWILATVDKQEYEIRKGDIPLGLEALIRKGTIELIE